MALLASIGEITVRTILGHKLTAGARAVLGGHTSVGIGGRPALIDAVAGSIPVVTIHADRIQMCQLKDLTIDATLSDVHRQHNRFAVGGSSATVLLATQNLQTMLQAKLGNGTQLALVPDTSQNRLDISVGSAGLLHVYVQPEFTGNALGFHPVSASIAGLPLPGGLGNLPGGLGNKLTASTSLQLKLPQLPLGMRLADVQVVSGGVALTATGQAAMARGVRSGKGTGIVARTC